MNIAILIKQVPDMERVKFDCDRGLVDRSTAGVEINPFDLNALEAGVKIAESKDCESVVLTMGPQRGVDSLREGIARGASKGILLSDRAFGGADTKATSKTLAAALKRMDVPEIILVGEKTVDGDTGQVGAEVAEFLGISHISYVEKIINVSENDITVVSDIFDGKFVKKAKFPVLLTVTKDLNVPRLPSFKSKSLARKAEIPTWSLVELSEFIDKEEVGIKGSPTKVRKIVVPKAESRVCKKEKENIENFLDEMIDDLIEKSVLEG